MKECGECEHRSGDDCKKYDTQLFTWEKYGLGHLRCAGCLLEKYRNNEKSIAIF